jgi:DNA-binding CsgD family transcriptional regulator
MRNPNLCVYHMFPHNYDLSRCKQNNCNICKAIFKVAGILGVLFEEKSGALVDISDSFCKDYNFKKSEIISENVFDTVLLVNSKALNNIKLLSSKIDSFQLQLCIKSEDKGFLNYVGTFNTYSVNRKRFVQCFLVPDICIDKKDLYTNQVEVLEGLNQDLKKKIDILENEKNELQKYLSNKFDISVRPLIETIEQVNKNTTVDLYLRIVKETVDDIFYENDTEGMSFIDKLTANENIVWQLIKEGKCSKEIAEVLNVSLATVSFHRHNIRKKLGLTHKKTSLSSFAMKEKQILTCF